MWIVDCIFKMHSAQNCRIGYLVFIALRCLFVKLTLVSHSPPGKGGGIQAAEERERVTWGRGEQSQ